MSWFAEYECGCCSEYFRYKKNILDYCATHGDDVRHYYKVKEGKNDT